MSTCNKEEFPMKPLRLVLITISLILLGGLCISFSTSSQTRESFTIEQVLSAPFPDALVAAPKGQRIAWTFDHQGKRNVWFAEGPEFKARQLTQYNTDDGQELTQLSFTHDGRFVVFVRGGDPNSAGEIPNPTSNAEPAIQAIHAVECDTGRIKLLAEGSDPKVAPTSDQVAFISDDQIHIVSITGNAKPQPLFIARGDNGAPEWSPDGKQLSFVSRRNTHSFIGVYDPGKQALRWIAPSIDRDTFPRWSPDGKRIAFIRQPARGLRPRPISEDIPDPWAIMLADAMTGQAKEVWRSGNRLRDSLPRYSGENVLQWGKGANGDDRLVFVSETDGWRRLYSIPASGGEVIALTPTNSEIEHITMTPDRLHLVFSSNHADTDRRHIWRIPAGGGELRSLTGGDGIQWLPVITGDGKKLAMFSSNWSLPARPAFSNLHQGVVSKLEGIKPEDAVQYVTTPAITPDFPNSKLVIPELVIFRAADGLEIHGQLFLPKNARPGEKLPAVVFAHGGPIRQMLPGWHYLYYYHNAYGFNQWLANKGYAVLSVNFRSGVGYGHDFRQAPKRGARGASEYQDIVAAAHYLRSRSDIDPSRIGMWGGSYGGYLTALALARNSDLFACGVDLHGVHDWSARISNAPWIDAGNREAAKIAFESSPVAAVDKWKSPVLFIHGDDDRNVAFSQTVDLAVRLRERNVPFEQIVYPDEVHDFLLHRNWIAIYKAAADFFDRHLKTTKTTSVNTSERDTRAPRVDARISGVDLLIRGGRVLDGSGADAVVTDIGIKDDRIVFIGDAIQNSLSAARTINAAGLIVAPGFIDPHTHAFEDLSNPQRKNNVNFLMQGVTTVFTGNDGGGPVNVGEVYSQWQGEGIGSNAAVFVGHGTVRGKVLGMKDSEPTAAELEQMKALVSRAMDDGALGLSSGLYYAPGSYGKTEEVIELAKIAAAKGGVYDTHMRDESSYTIGLLGSIRETIRIGREAKIPVHISHIKALGTDVWGQSRDAIAIIEAAQREGVRVTANQYPYTASGTSVGSSLLPRWAEVGGNKELLKRIDDPAVRPMLMAEMEANMKRRGGAESLLITGSRNKQIVGKTLGRIAQEWNQTPIEAALEIIKAGGAGVASFNMSEQDIENFMRQPWVMTGSDGSGGHPRKYGTYPRKLREYVFKRRVITLPFAIRSSSALVAETFGLSERGKIAQGYFADIVVFDETTIADRATYEQPELLSEGMKFVIVNGRLAVEDGKYTGALVGRPLSKRANRADGGR
jgi:N-acyl-D-aspartate/D-glutamate deacylase/dipeptidyl aminopeptidase/acylaminoacyl peptidase